MSQILEYGELQTIPCLVAVVFLGLNGFAFDASNQTVVVMVQRLAAGHLSWPELEAWFTECARAIP